MRKYLDELGIKFEDTPQGYCIGKNDDRESKWAEERETYGFDQRETWSLDHNFSMWIYERLMMYLEVADKYINLDYHTFEYEGKTLTQRECINRMLEGFGLYAKEKWEFKLENEKKMDDAFKIFALCYPVMWW